MNEETIQRICGSVVHDPEVRDALASMRKTQLAAGVSDAEAMVVVATGLRHYGFPEEAIEPILNAVFG